jgi:putative sigma-54 modulation protein
MHLECHIDKSLPNQVRETTEERVVSKLSRFQEQIKDVSVTLRDLNGPKGGVDIQCRIHLNCEMTGETVIEETAENVGSALTGALDRTVHTLSRKRDQVVKKQRHSTTIRGAAEEWNQETL